MKYIFLLYFLNPIFVMSQNDFAKAEKLYQQGQISQAKIIFEAIFT